MCLEGVSNLSAANPMRRPPSTSTCILWLVFLLPKMEMEVEVQGKTRSRIIKPNKGRGFYITLEQEE